VVAILRDEVREVLVRTAERVLDGGATGSG
jgi:hypothetical protein